VADTICRLQGTLTGTSSDSLSLLGSSNTGATVPRANFDTPDGEDIDIDSDEVAHLSPGQEEGTTRVEMEDGSEIVVVATQLEVAAELGLNPLDYVDPEDDDESLEDLVDNPRDGDEPDEDPV
jgi:hypothetical protein